VNPRHRARRLVLQGLCCLDAQGPKAALLVHEFITDSKEAGETLRIAHALLDEVFGDHQECDALLVRHARHWDLGRLAMVDRNILRLASYELRFNRAPVKVVITEAIRLAREFSTAESPRFINGVLDAIARELRSTGAVGADEEKIGRDAEDAGDTDSGEEEEGRNEGEGEEGNDERG
jgi:N utilization substance protein B